MGFFGKLLGGLAGNVGSALFPTYSNGKQVDGGAIGSQLGDLLPFQKGGMVPRPRRRYQKSAKKPASKRKSRKKK